jgi:hypothetical protein
MVNYRFLPLADLPGYVGLLQQPNFVYSEEVAFLRDLQVESDESPLDIQHPVAGDWARLGDTRTLEDMFALLQNPGAEFVKHYQEMQNKKWYRVRKAPVHDARARARLKYGDPRRDLRVGMYVAAFVDPLSQEAATLRTWGRYYWLGKVTYISSWAAGGDPAGDYQVRCNFLPSTAPKYTPCE